MSNESKRIRMMEPNMEVTNEVESNSSFDSVDSEVYP